MNSTGTISPVHGRKALIISAICFVGWLIMAFGSRELLSSISLFVLVGPAAAVGDVVALVYAVKALSSKQDEKAKAWLAIFLACPVLVLTVVIFLALGNLRLYQ